MVMLSGLLGFMLLGGIAFLPDVEPPISEEEEFESDAPEFEESAQPTDGPDLLWGRFLDDMIDGRGGDDQIHGYDGNDTLNGADGNHTVIGGNGDDVMTGGHGNDVHQGLTGNDELHGENNNDHLAGGTGHVTLMGGAGDDMLIDTDLERDYLHGGEGDDSFHSYGADVMTGGDGADTFVYTDVGDVPIEITDFDPTVDTMAIQFHENDLRDISVHPVSEDVYEIRLGDQVAAHVKSTVPFDASSILVQTHT